MIAQSRLSCILAGAASTQGPDGIYSAQMPSHAHDQQAERDLREGVAARDYDNYLIAIARSHSIQVMDHEIDRFLRATPLGAVILDIGGCWGWHWRRLASTRPDVGVLIVDFVRANLRHAQRVLGPLVGTQIALMHADATALPFPDAGASSPGFEGVWSVQTFQHIPDFTRACREAHRVLKSGGRFANYSLHVTPFNRLVCRLVGRTFHTDGTVTNQYHLTRANDGQRKTIAGIFGATVTDRYTECLFHPDLKLTVTGRAGSWIGLLDAHLGGASWLARVSARQRSFEAVKS